MHCRRSRRTGAFGLLEFLVGLTAVAVLTALGAPLAEEPQEEELRPAALTCGVAAEGADSGRYCPLPE